MSEVKPSIILIWGSGTRFSCFHRTIKTQIMNWVARAPNDDWLKAVEYETVYHRYDRTFIFTVLFTFVTDL